jgi:hypothetical protein
MWPALLSLLMMWALLATTVSQSSHSDVDGVVSPQSGHCVAGDNGCTADRDDVGVAGGSMPPLFRDDGRTGEFADAAVAVLDAHAAWQRSILDAAPDAASTTRFLVFRPRRTGVGNVVEALLSSLLFAVLTRRVFLVSACRRLCAVSVATLQSINTRSILNF